MVKFNTYAEFNEGQKTKVQEMVDFEEQFRHSIHTNDFVIAPVDSSNGSYEFGVVIEGHENRMEQISKFLITQLK